MTVSFEFSESFARVRVGFTPDLPLAEFYGLEPSLFPEPPGNTDIGEIYEPPTEVQIGRSTVRSCSIRPRQGGGQVTPDLRSRSSTAWSRPIRRGDHPGRVATVRPADREQIAELLDCWVQDAFSRFARTAEVTVYDPDSAMESIPLDTPVELWVSEDGGRLRLRFGGFISKTSNDADTTTWKLLAHDFWLRRRTVFKTYLEQPISQILEDLVTTLTPLTWDPALVAVTYDKTLTQTWKGDPLDVVLAELSVASDGEEFGADDQMRFFFRPRRSSRSPRDFVEGEYLDAEFEDDAQAEVNKVTIYWGQSGATGAVSVQDRASQLRLQQQFGAPRPVVVEVVKTYPELASEAEARQKAAAILADRQVIRTGTVTT